MDGKYVTLSGVGSAAAGAGYVRRIEVLDGEVV
jgi:hypothetical protein